MVRDTVSSNCMLVCTGCAGRKAVPPWRQVNSFPHALPIVKLDGPGVNSEMLSPAMPSEVEELWPKSDCVVKGFVRAYPIRNSLRNVGLKRCVSSKDRPCAASDVF